VTEKALGDEPERLPLDAVQRWFQAVITHPNGVEEGVSSQEAQRIAHLRRDEIERIVRRSRQLSAEERIGIYAFAYYARLLEVLGEGFPSLRRLLGQEVFEGFAFEYLERYPSRSYTLDHLGARFPRFLEETRSADAGEPPAWPELLVDLALLEWEIAKVFDGPGLEAERPLAPADLEALGAERFASARLVAAPSLRLLAFRFPVNDLYTEIRNAGEGDEIALPSPAPERLALCRSDFIVRRYPLRPWQHVLLEALVAGGTVGEAIARAAAVAEADESTAFSEDEIGRAFGAWTAAGFFRALA